jgi:hypothetical protein
VALVLALGCDGSPPAQPPAAASNASSTAVPAATATVTVTIDGASQRSLAIAEGQRLSLSEALAEPNPQRWHSLHASAHDGRELVVGTLGASYEGGEQVFLSLGADRRAVLGFYRKILPAMPEELKRALAKPRLELVDVAKVDITTKPKDDKAAPKEAELVVSAKGVDKTIDAEALKRLTGDPAAEDREARMGRPVEQALAELFPGTKVEALEFTLRDGKRERVEAARWREKGVAALLRTNRRGLVLFELKRGDERLFRLRDVTRIDLVAPGAKPAPAAAKASAAAP